MPALEFVGQSSRDAGDIAASTGRLVNCYRQATETGIVIGAVPGATLFATMAGASLRAMATVEGVVYAVFGGGLWSITSGAATVRHGDIPDSPYTSISGNNGKVTVVADTRYFVWDGAALTEPAAGAFSGFGSVAFLGQLTILTEFAGRRVQWSGVADPETLNGLDFATTESRDDNNLRAMVFGPELWIFKETSIERWAQDGVGVSSLPGATIGKGLKAFGLVVSHDLGGFFIGRDNRAYLCGPGGVLQEVSTKPVRSAIVNGDPRACLYYEDQGRGIVCIVFADRPAWCLDLETGEWHERAVGTETAWGARGAAMAYGRTLVADDLGQVYTADRSNQDAGAPLIRRMVSRNLTIDGNRTRVARLTFQARTGYAASPLAMLRTSKDRGNTFGAPKEKSLGAVGQYETQVTFRSLGQYRNFVCELSVSDPSEITVDAAAFVELA